MPDGSMMYDRLEVRGAGRQRRRFAELLGSLTRRLGSIDLRLRLYRVRIDGLGRDAAEEVVREAGGRSVDVVELSPASFGVLAASEANHPACFEARLSRALRQRAGESAAARMAVLEVWSADMVDPDWTVSRLEAAPDRLVMAGRA